MRVNELTTSALFVPSDAEKVIVNVPCTDVLGVTVNTLFPAPVGPVNVAILPIPDAVAVYVIGKPSGSVATIVIVVAVPSVARVYV